MAAKPTRTGASTARTESTPEAAEVPPRGHDALARDIRLALLNNGDMGPLEADDRSRGFNPYDTGVFNRDTWRGPNSR